MSYADRVLFKTAMICKQRFWDTDYNVRPRWSDGAPAHTIKKFGIINRYVLSKEFPFADIAKNKL